MRTFTPVVMASVIANVSTKLIFAHVLHEKFEAIFDVGISALQADLSWSQVPIYILLGVLCGIVV